MLITIDDIKTVREVANSVKANKLNPIIMDAEICDLRPLLGEELYNDITQRPTATDKGDYPKLISGGSYTYQGYPYSHPGLKGVLIDFAYARYRFFGNDTDTPFGVVEKRFENGPQTSSTRNREVYESLRKVALAKWSLVKLYLDFMNSQTDTYFEYWNCEVKQLDDSQASVVMNVVTIR